MRNTCFTVSPSGVVISPASPGSRSRLAASNRVGSTVPSHGAVTPSTISTRSAHPPMRTDQFWSTRLIADPPVEEHVREVDQQVDRNVDEREEQAHTLDGGKVARQHR